MSDYCERPEFFSERTVVAKKKHVCDECRRPIYPGDKYEYFSGKSDGDFWTAHQHTYCANFCRYVNHKSGLMDGCTPFGDTLFCLQEVAGGSGMDDSRRFRRKAAELIWLFKSMVSGCNERFGTGEGI